ncbi:MAG: hypothetical protein C0502_04815 [Opitutus sp.]|nr:hypothetical protein [Opitutus sp.]
MSTFIIDVPMPSMGATVSELTIVNIVVAPGAAVKKGQKLAELESDKSAFDFECPADGKILEVHGNKGEVKSSGRTLFRMETGDQSLQHLAIATAKHDAEVAAQAAAPASAPAAAPAAGKALVWTPRATKMAQEAGLDPAKITDIEATGPGGRVSGDDVSKYLASRK